jgi:DNA-binding response OmpR family regulator
MKILVIEDEEPLRMLYKDALTGQGHEVELTPDGWEGFTEGGSGAYDLVIADLNMPNWDGATSIRSMGELNPDLPVIVATGFAGSSIADEVKLLPQVKAVMAKPLDLKELFQLIDSLDA